MNIKSQDTEWGLAFIRESPLPPDQTWTEVPFYTYLMRQDKETFYKAMRKDRPVDITAIKSYPVLSFVDFSIEIKPEQAVFVDWEGNYFIDKENSVDLKNRTIVHENKVNKISSIAPKTLVWIKQFPNYQTPIVNRR
jgi:hypothetical protein